MDGPRTDASYPKINTAVAAVMVTVNGGGRRDGVDSGGIGDPTDCHCSRNLCQVKGLVRS